MTCIATCGHEITAEWMDDPRCYLIEKSQTREGDRALSYTVRCAECRDWFEKEGVLFGDGAAAERWLQEEPAP